jgi:sugar (pentulose or hexulose) kinase
MKTLGIDVGTGGTRAVVVDPDGNVVATVNFVPVGAKVEIY